MDDNFSVIPFHNVAQPVSHLSTRGDAIKKKKQVKSSRLKL